MNPYRLALINTIAGNGYESSFLEEKIFRKTFVVPQVSVSETLRVFDEAVRCEVVHAYYLSGFRVKAAGERPKGRLRATVDREPVVHEDLDFFSRWVDPAKVPWRSDGFLFLAAPFEGDVVHPEKRLGYMLPNGSRIEVFFELEPGPEGSVELEVQCAEYECKGPSIPIPWPLPKEIRA